MLKIAVIGAAGYTGYELLKILGKHKFADVILATSNSNKGKTVGEVFPSLSGYGSILKFESTEGIKKDGINKSDVVFLCLPPYESMEFAGRYLSEFTGSIIDIGSDFRLQDEGDYCFWYGREHSEKKLLGEFVYGLPEVNFHEIKKAKNIANPGCYPTSILLGLAPLLKKHTGPAFSNNDFEVEDINIDSKSGVSGAGKKLKEQYLFCSVNENFYAYSATMHRHIGEIEQELKKYSSRDLKICFTPHLLPVDRGIFSSIYCRVKTSKKENEIKEYIEGIYIEFYRECSFVKFLGENIPQIKNVAHTNFCHIGYALDDRTKVLKIFSAIDNLVKGAAGQAVQNMNIIFDLNQQEGLDG